MAEFPNATVVVAVLVMVALVAAGPAWSDTRDLGDGSADVRIVTPSWLAAGDGAADHRLRTTPGRFGTAAPYVRTPDVVADVSNVTGEPELYYDFSVPAIDVDPSPGRRHLDGPGRYRLHFEDVAIAPTDYHRPETVPADGTYTGRILVRVQSFSGHRVVANRSVEVVVDR